jgi:hypothetical protein
VFPLPSARARYDYTNTIAANDAAVLVISAAGLTMIDRRREEREITTSAIIMYTVRRAVIG